MMVYNKFNKFIKEKFFSLDKRGESILFSVDESVIDEFILLEKIENPEFNERISSELRLDWAKQCEQENFFGICAIQTYIASLMHNDSEYTSVAYNPRFQSFLKIDQNRRHKLFSTYQFKIWENLSNWCLENDFYINIPDKESLPWNRQYVSFPLSQALLNKEDLKMSNILFEKVGINKSEFISFTDFSEIILRADNGICMSSHYYKVKNRLNNEFGETEQITRQLYNYFTDEWDGQYPVNDQHLNFPIKTERRIKDLHLILNRTIDSIIVHNNEYEQKANIPLSKKNIFKSIEKYHTVYSEDFLIFMVDANYESEYVRKFEIGEKYIIICSQQSKASKYISSLCKTEKIENSFYDIYITQTLRKKSNHAFWEKHFSKQSRNYRIEGGVKLGYKSWMVGCGPKIIFNEKSVVRINGIKFEEIEIICTDYPIGVYKIVKDSSIEKIEIKNSLNIENKDCSGWNVDKQTQKWNPDDSDFQVTGLIYCFPAMTKTSTIHDWIEILTTKKTYKKHSSTVLNALKRSKYGI